MNLRGWIRLVWLCIAGILIGPTRVEASPIGSPQSCKATSAKVSAHTMNILRQMYEGLDVEHNPNLARPDPSNLFWQNQIRLGYVTYSCDLGEAPKAAALPSPFPENPCNHDAHVAVAASAAPPPTSSASDRYAVVLVNVAIDGDGKPAGVTIAEPLSADLDAKALDAASRSTFAPKLRDCKIVPTTLLYAVLVGL